MAIYKISKTNVQTNIEESENSQLKISSEFLTIKATNNLTSVLLSITNLETGTTHNVEIDLAYSQADRLDFN